MDSIENHIEVNSLSLQGTKPLEVLYSPEVTDKMLDNAEKALQIIKNEYPTMNCGLNLHAGAVIDMEKVSKSDIPITSVDVPDIAYPSETFAKIIERPTQLPAHVAWRLNSVLGFNSQSAEKSRNDRLYEAFNLEPYRSQPFVRASVQHDLQTGVADEYFFLNLAKKFPGVSIAIEYNAEVMGVDGYLKFVKGLNKKNGVFGISMDLAHVYEHFSVNQGLDVQSSLIATMNFWESTLKRTELITSIDINNVLPGTKSFGETHKKVLEPGGAIPIKDMLELYRKKLDTYKLAGRIAIEPSPRDNELLLTSNGAAYLLSQIKPFVTQ